MDGPPSRAETGSPGGGSSARDSPRSVPTAPPAFSSGSNLGPDAAAFSAAANAQAIPAAGPPRPPSLPYALSLTRWGSTGAPALMHPAPALVHSNSARAAALQAVAGGPLPVALGGGEGGGPSGPSAPATAEGVGSPAGGEAQLLAGEMQRAFTLQGAAANGALLSAGPAMQLNNPLYRNLSVELVPADDNARPHELLRGGGVTGSVQWIFPRDMCRRFFFMSILCS